MEMGGNYLVKIKFILFVIAALFSGCNTLSKKYGTDFNPERKRLGIPLLPADWHLKKDFYDNEHIQWRRPGNALNCYYLKTVELSNDSILNDNSSFISQNRYLADESYNNKMIEIRYLFPAGANSRSEGSTVILYRYNEPTHFFPDTITKTQTDSVFTEWHINPSLAWE